MAFQTKSSIVEGDKEPVEMLPRTFEEAIAYQNFRLLRSGDLNLGIDIPDQLEDAYDAIWKRIKSSTFKKTDFAMALLDDNVAWETPEYIS